MTLKTKLLIFFLVLISLLALQWFLFIGHERRLLSDEAVSRAGILVRTLAELAREPMASSRYTRWRTSWPPSSGSGTCSTPGSSTTGSGLSPIPGRRRRAGLIPERSPGLSRLPSRGPPCGPGPHRPAGKADRHGGDRLLHGPGTGEDQPKPDHLRGDPGFPGSRRGGLLVLDELQIIAPLRYLSRLLSEAPPETEAHVIGVPRFSSVEIRAMIASVNAMRERLVAFRKDSVEKARFATMGKIGANMAHEIRNPLEAISGAVELMDGDAVPAAESAEYLGIIREEIRNLDEFLGEFLEFAKPQPHERHRRTSTSSCGRRSSCLTRWRRSAGWPSGSSSRRTLRSAWPTATPSSGLS
jgi:hypothetical protein